MSSKKFQEINKEIIKINSMIKDLGVVEEVMEKEVKTFGNGGHIILPKNYLNRRVKIII